MIKHVPRTHNLDNLYMVLGLFILLCCIKIKYLKFGNRNWRLLAIVGEKWRQLHTVLSCIQRIIQSKLTHPLLHYKTFPYLVSLLKLSCPLLVSSTYHIWGTLLMTPYVFYIYSRTHIYVHIKATMLVSGEWWPGVVNTLYCFSNILSSHHNLVQPCSSHESSHLLLSVFCLNVLLHIRILLLHIRILHHIDQIALFRGSVISLGMFNITHY